MSDFDAKLIVRGTSRGTKESRNERGQVTGYTVQLLKRNAKNGLEVIPVRLPEGADPSAYAEGKQVELPVDISNYEGTMYYRAAPETAPKSTDGRGTDAPRATPSPTPAPVKA
jgi:hypothetical protein